MPTIQAGKREMGLGQLLQLNSCFEAIHIKIQQNKPVILKG